MIQMLWSRVRISSSFTSNHYGINHYRLVAQEVLGRNGNHDFEALARQHALAG
jgi:hypothetical protein